MMRFLHNLRAVLVMLLMIIGLSNVSASTIEIETNVTSIELGQSITLTATATDFTPPYYHFYYSVDGSTPARLVQSTESNVCIYTPSACGTYTFYVNAYDGTSVYPESEHITVTVAPSTVTLSASETSVKAGTEITLTATPSNLDSPIYTYFVSTDDGTNYTEISSGSSSTLKYRPCAKGTYLFKVTAADSYNTVNSNVVSVTSSTVNPYIIFTVTPSGNYVNDPITLTATPVCCNPTTYRLFAQKDGGTISMQQEGSNNTFTFTPIEPGSYVFYAEADYSTHTYKADSYNEPVKIGGITITPRTASVSGFHTWEPITINVESVNCEPTCYFYYYSLDYGQTYTPITDNTCTQYSGEMGTLNSSISFTPTVEGDYTLKVKAFVDLTQNPYLSTEACKDITVKKIMQKITPNDNGVLSCVASYPLDLSSVSGLKAYVATNVTPTAVTLVSTDKVDQGEAFVVTGTANTTYEVPSTSSCTHDEGYTNYFCAADGIKKASDYGTYIYCLNTSGVFQQVADDVVIPSGKAYLQYNETSTTPAKTLILNFDGESTTDIRNITENISKTTMYNIAGQRVNNTAKGLVIVNGKKYMK